MDKISSDFSKLLKPLNRKDEGIWNKFLEISFENIIWYPSAGSDFLDLIHEGNLGQNTPGSTLFLHSDQLLQDELLDNMGREEGGQIVRINRIIELKLTDEFKPEYDPGFISNLFPLQKKYEMIIADRLNNEVKEKEKNGFRKGGVKDKMTPKSEEEVDRIYNSLKPEMCNKYLGKAFLLDINVSFQGQEIKNRDLLYFSFDNISFLREFIIKNNVPVSTIVSVRDQMVTECREKFWKYLAEYSSIVELVCEDHLLFGFEQNIINGTQGPENLIFKQTGEFKWNEVDDVRHFKIIRK
ncbi:MAG: hypothetical protein ACM3NR_03220 [Methanosarcina sp.]